MLGSIISGALKVRLALWAAGRVLPSQEKLKYNLHTCLVGVMVAVAAGVLTALAVCVLLATAGFFLYTYGYFTVFEAMIAMALVAFVVVLCLGVYGYSALTKAFRNLSSQPLGKSLSDENALQALINGFIAGLVSGGEHGSGSVTKAADEENPKVTPIITGKKVA